MYLLSMDDIEDPSNILNGMGLSKYEKFSLFTFANISCTKLWEDPESSKALKGQEGFWNAEEVRERKNELGERDATFNQRTFVLLVVGQPSQSTREELPIHFLPVQNPTGAPALLALPFLLQPNSLLSPLYLPDRLLLSGHPCHKPGIVCSLCGIDIPPTLVIHGILILSCSWWFPLVGCFSLPAVWLTCIPPAIPNTDCHNSGLLRPFPGVYQVFQGLQSSLLSDPGVHCKIGIIGQHLHIPLWL